MRRPHIVQRRGAFFICLSISDGFSEPNIPVGPAQDFPCGLRLRLVPEEAKNRRAGTTHTGPQRPLLYQFIPDGPDLPSLAGRQHIFKDVIEAPGHSTQVPCLQCV